MRGSSLTLFFQSSGNSNWKITVRLQPVDTFSLCSLLSCREKRGSCRRLIPAGSKPAWLHGLFHLYETGKKDWALALLPWELSSVCSSKNQHLSQQQPLPFILLQGQVQHLCCSAHISFPSAAQAAWLWSPSPEASPPPSVAAQICSVCIHLLPLVSLTGFCKGSTMLHTGTIIWPQSHTQLKRHKTYSLF